MASRKPTDEQWELNKGVIRRLYLVNNSTLQELMKAMAERGFRATRAQFESRLKLWNFRKYLNGDGAWRYVADRISKRESQGRRSRVIVSGIAYDDEKVRREIARCRPCTLVKVDEVERPKTPEGMAICVASPPVLAHTSSWPPSLPWLVFQRRLLDGSVGQSYLASGINMRPQSARHNPEATETLLYKISRACQFPRASVTCLAEALGALMPEEHEFEHLSRAEVFYGKGTKEMEQEAVKTMLFFVSNKQMKDRDEQLVDIFQDLIATNNWGALLTSVGGATVAAFGEAVFEAAVVSSSKPALSFLLRNGFSAKTRIGMSTALQVATALYKDERPRFDIVNTLIQAGADVNEVTQWNSLSPLQLAVANQWDDGVALFLSHGADINYAGTEGRHFSFRGQDLHRKDAPLTPFLIATRNFDWPMMANLVDHKAEIDLGKAIDLVVAEARLYDGKSGDASDDDFDIRSVFSGDSSDGSSSRGSSSTGRPGTGCKSSFAAFFEKTSVPRESSISNSEKVNQSFENRKPKPLRLLQKLFLMKRRQAPGVIDLGHTVSGYAVLNAAYLCHEGILSLFNDEGASMDVEAASPRSYPMSAAVQSGVINRSDEAEERIMRTCQLLHRFGARIDPNPHGSVYGTYASAMLYAALEGFADLVRWFLDNGADPNYSVMAIHTNIWRSPPPLKSSEMLTPVSVCSWAPKSAECLEILLQRGRRCTGAELINACRRRNFRLVDILVRFGADVNQNYEGQTPLYVALQQSAVNTAWYLLKNGACPMDGYAALAFASESRELIEELLCRGCQLTDDAPDGTSALEAAISASKGDRFWVDRILQIDQDRYDSSILCAAAYRALSTAASWTDFDVLEDILLRRRPEKCDPVLENTALAMAIYKSNIAVLRMLLDRAPPMLKDSPCLLSGSFKLRHPQTRSNPGPPFRSLPTDDDDEFRSSAPCSDNYIHLMWRPPSPSLKTSLITSTIIRHQYTLIPVLHARGYRPSALSLLLAVSTMRTSVVRMVLDAGASPNAVSRHCRISPLQLAVAWGLSAIATLLLGAGADANSCPAEAPLWPRTPLQLAIEHGAASLALELLKAGADVNYSAPDAKHSTALNLAVMNGNVNLIKLVLDAGADVNTHAQGKGGATALQIASIGGRLGIAKHLLERGADPNAPASPYEGRTALEGAAEHGRIDMIQLLLEQGVLTTGEHHRPFLRAVKYALREGHFAAARLLQNYREWTEEDFAGLAMEQLLDEKEASDSTAEDVSPASPGTKHDDQHQTTESTEASISESDSDANIIGQNLIGSGDGVEVIVDQNGVVLLDLSSQRAGLEQTSHSSQWSVLDSSPSNFGNFDPTISGFEQESLGIVDNHDMENDAEGPYMDMLNVLDSDVDWLLSNLGNSQ